MNTECARSWCKTGNRCGECDGERQDLIDRARRIRVSAEEWLRDVEHAGPERSGATPAEVEQMRRHVAALKHIESQATPAPPQRADHVVLDGKTGKFLCTHCGVTSEVVLPMLISEISKRTTGFLKAHRSCPARAAEGPGGAA